MTSFCHGIRKSGEVRAASWSCIDNLNLGEEAVAATSNGFHKAGTLGGVAEGLTDLLIALLRPWSKSTKSPRARFSELLPNDLAGVLKHRQELKGLFLKPYRPVFAIRRPKIQFENPKTKPPVVKVFLHGDESECTTRRVRRALDGTFSHVAERFRGPHSRRKLPSIEWIARANNEPLSEV
jgi:hypothetical protein